MHNRTHLLLAIRTNDDAAVSVLIQQIDVDAIIDNGKTAMQVAWQLKSKACIQAIAKNKKAGEGDKGKYGDVLLSLIGEGDVQTSRLLLEAGASTTWYFPDTGDRGLHLATRKNNPKMVALLLEFNYDLQVKNTAGLTPPQLADSLKVTALDKGWEIYRDTVKMVYYVIAQSTRQKATLFFNMPTDWLNLIGSFAYQQNFFNVKFAQDFLVRISARCLINSFHGTFRKHTTESKNFVSQLKNDLEDKSISHETIRKTALDFIEKNKGKRTKTLIDKYKLTAFTPPVIKIPECTITFAMTEDKYELVNLSRPRIGGGTVI